MDLALTSTQICSLMSFCMFLWRCLALQSAFEMLGGVEHGCLCVQSGEVLNKKEKRSPWGRGLAQWCRHPRTVAECLLQAFAPLEIKLSASVHSGGLQSTWCLGPCVRSKLLVSAVQPQLWPAFGKWASEGSSLCLSLCQTKPLKGSSAIYCQP